MRVLVLLAALLSGLAEAGVRLYVFDCGSLTLTDVRLFGLENDETPVRELSVPCYLVEHRAGQVRRLLFDAGLDPAIAGKGTVEPEPGMTLRYQASLEDQLAELGLTPADVDFVAFSHLHFDHVGSANLFTDAVHLIQSAEHQALLVRLENTGPVLLSGDLYHFRVSRAERRVPVFNTDAAQTLVSMDEVEALLRREGATLWIEHDMALAETLRKAPEYYD